MIRVIVFLRSACRVPWAQDDKTGEGSTEKLRKICKEFSLTLDIDKFIEEVDQDGSGTVDFEEFSKMMAAAR